MSARPYTTAELAQKLGHGADWLYRHYARLVRDDGLPPRLVSFGRYRFHRGAVDAWLARRERSKQTTQATPANDDADAWPTAPDAGTWRDALAREYGPR